MTRRTFERFSALSAVLTLAVALASCGGGGDDNSIFDGTHGNPSGANNPGFGSNGSGSSGGTVGGSYLEGKFTQSSTYAGKCIKPRTAVNPATGQSWGDVKGTATDENNWLRSWTHELYLWYREVPDLNPSTSTDPLEFFDMLKTSATLNGAAKDKFHFTYDTDYWQSLSTAGQDVSYGMSVALLATLPPRKAVVAYTETNAPAATLNAGMTRGVEIIGVDGVDLVTDNTQAGVTKINAALFPDTVGESHSFQVRDLNGAVRTVTLQSAVVTTKPVLVTQVLSTPTGPVGYLLFNDHLATAESALFNAISTLKGAGINALVLDLRYNGGGYLDIASELAYMIAGPTQTGGQTFEKLQFNDKYPNTDPVTNEALTPTAFHSKSLGIDAGLASNTTLPTLDLQRVYVLTGATTCSASEAIINGLRGVNVDVIQIGSTTCGKPYGFYPTDNCGTTYFSIQFRGVNAKDFGDYTNGFTPSVTPSASDSSQVQGCTVADDFTHALGDAGENLLETALDYRTTGACVALATSMSATGVQPLSSMSARVVKPEWRMNRVLRR